MSEPRSERSLTVRVGRDELVIRRRYEVASIANDVLIAAWFIGGSILFFYPNWMTLGTWFFLAGSVELLIRPMIRFTRLVHVQRVQKRHRHGGAPRESSQDF